MVVRLNVLMIWPTIDNYPFEQSSNYTTQMLPTLMFDLKALRLGQNIPLILKAVCLSARCYHKEPFNDPL